MMGGRVELSVLSSEYFITFPLNDDLECTVFAIWYCGEQFESNG